MKYFKILAILLFSSVISFYACNDNTNSPKKETPKPFEVSNSPTPTNATTPNAATPEASQNAGGVWHYICIKGCAGGAESAVNCDTCGSLLAHNQAYHANANSTPIPIPFLTPPAAEAGKNTAGVWHYTCAKGCAGGSGSAVNCENCGSLLAHNQAYHANPNSTSTPIPFTSPPAAEAGKNTAGVWHYTCAKGCAGGSGSAGTCGTCGDTLAHNQAYHQ
jgi:ribosomal protein S27E